MTAVPAPAPQSRSPLLWLLLAAVLLAAGVKVAPRMHAVVKHGLEAVAIRNACDQYGPDYVFKSLSPKDNKYFQVCPLEDGRYGIRVIQCTAKGWVERTSFVAKSIALGDGTWERTWEYLSARSELFRGKLSEACK